MSASRIAVIALLLALGPVAGRASAHELASGLCRATYRAETSKLEVEWRLDSAEVEAALGRTAGKSIDLDSLPRAQRDELLARYLGPRFRAGKGDARAPWRLVGSSIEGADLWAFVEVDLPGGLDGVTVEATALFDSAHEVRHQLVVAWNQRRWSATLDRAHPRIELSEAND